MLKKPLRRVRRKKGAILFAVISIMALLIAMASTAYFTAKSAYNSVISNYSYSQLYLSAISVSDMVIEAIANDATVAASSSDGSDTAKNYYQSLRDAIINNLDNVGDSIYAYSPNITLDPSTATEEQIIEQLKSADPTVPGALDGIVVEVKLDNVGPAKLSPTADPAATTKLYAYEHSYTLTTVAYYRNNSITVEDVIKTDKFKRYTPGSGGGGGGGSELIPGSEKTIPGSGGSGGGFSTFFTATGQKLTDGEITRSTRTVKIKTHEISDDAFYQNSATYFVNGNNNDFVGGITSTGSVYLEKFTTNISGKDNDWWIGDDLVMTNNNANNLNLTDQNSLYVGDDLVIAANGNITAKDIYVMGDLYIMGQAKFTGNLHVSGNIYYEMGDTVKDDKGNDVPSASAIAAADGVTLGATKWDQYTNGWTVTGNLDVNGKVTVPSGSTNNAKITVGTTTYEIPTGTAASKEDNAIGTYDPTKITVDYNVKVPDTSEDLDKDGKTDEFVSQPASGSVSAAIQNNAGENVPYYNYTTPSTAFKNEVVVDFSKLAAVYGEDGKSILYYEYTDPNTGVYLYADYQDTNLGNCKNVSVTLPDYSKYSYTDSKTGQTLSNGYVLDIKADSFSTISGNANITYNIPTSDKTDGAALPIVLKNNILIDADGDGEKDDPGFAWQGNNYSTNDNEIGTVVQAIGDGNVVFEMANLDKDGKLTTYNSAKDSEITVVTYVAGQKEVVGNEAQCAVIGGGGVLDDGKVSTMLQSGTSIPKDGYYNQIMLVSNKNNGVAVDMARQNNAFCGYVYAPNGELNNFDASGETEPIFGGMIVSTYNADLSKLYYAEPKPSAISSMLGNLISGSNNNNTTDSTTEKIPDSTETWVVDPTPPTDGTYTDVAPDGGKYNWEFRGSNFVG